MIENMIKKRALPVHISESEATWAAISGTMLGLGLVGVPSMGVGILIGLAGAMQVHDREHNQKIDKLIERAAESFRDID